METKNLNKICENCRYLSHYLEGEPFCSFDNPYGDRACGDSCFDDFTTCQGFEENAPPVFQRDSIQQLREELCSLAAKLVKQEDLIYDTFTKEELKSFFRCRDSIQVLVPHLWDLSVALYKNKVAI